MVSTTAPAATPRTATTGTSTHTPQSGQRVQSAQASAQADVRDESCREGLCPKYQKAMALLGKRWTGLVLRVLLDGPSRFGDFLARIDGISDPILSERLKELECQGLVQRRVLPETPVRVEYALTPKGDGLREILLSLHKWAETWSEADKDCEAC